MPFSHRSLLQHLAAHRIWDSTGRYHTSGVHSVHAQVMTFAKQRCCPSIWLPLCLTMMVAGPATTDIPTSNNEAVQTIYQQGVPHTDRRGVPMTDFDPARSFFPIGIWGAQLPGNQWDSVSDWTVLEAAGFNCVWPWYTSPEQGLKAGADHGMQIVLMGAIKEEDLEAVKDHPNLLGNVWEDEPIGRLQQVDMDALFAEFNTYREGVKSIAPHLPVFINDAPWIMPPATDWWLKWNNAGDLACHDNYPVMNRKHRARSIGAEPNGIPQSVSLGVANGAEKRAQWLIVGAFEQPGEFGQSFPFRFPTPDQLRASVYAGLIHGATGIIYFTWDTYVPRDGGVIGMAPNPLPHYTPNPRQEGYTRPTPATPMQLVQSQALWSAATQINTELGALTPSLLSPTAPTDVQPVVELEGEPVTEAPIRILLKPGPEGTYTMLTVNLDDAMLKVTYTFSKTLNQVSTRFENQLPVLVEESARTFSHSYEPFAVHVFDVQFAL